MQPLSALCAWNRACALALSMNAELDAAGDRQLAASLHELAVDVASDIADGCERRIAAEYLACLDRARGRLAALRTRLYLAHERHAIAPPTAYIQESLNLSRLLGRLVDDCAQDLATQRDIPYLRVAER